MSYYITVSYCRDSSGNLWLTGTDRYGYLDSETQPMMVDTTVLTRWLRMESDTEIVMTTDGYTSAKGKKNNAESEQGKSVVSNQHRYVSESRHPHLSSLFVVQQTHSFQTSKNPSYQVSPITHHQPRNLQLHFLLVFYQLSLFPLSLSVRRASQTWRLGGGNLPPLSQNKIIPMVALAS
jgi:hypothetical protein